jgi:Immunoglobulin-like domain of bacterial spore germination
MNNPNTEGPPKVRPMSTTTITITTPTNGLQVTSPFTATGTCSLNVTSITLTLTSSLGTVADINVVITPTNGAWSYTFTVNPADYPGTSTLTATVTGMQVSASVDFEITG